MARGWHIKVAWMRFNLIGLGSQAKALLLVASRALRVSETDGGTLGGWELVRSRVSKSFRRQDQDTGGIRRRHRQGDVQRKEEAKSSALRLSRCPPSPTQGCRIPRSAPAFVASSVELGRLPARALTASPQLLGLDLMIVWRFVFIPRCFSWR